MGAEEGMRGKWLKLAVFIWKSNYVCRGMLGET